MLIIYEAFRMFLFDVSYQPGSLTGHVSVVIWTPGNSIAEAIGGHKDEADFVIAD